MHYDAEIGSGFLSTGATGVAVLAVVAVLGLVVGSFLNVVIWRVPRGESVVQPRSHCPECDAELKPRDNIPVLSWLVLRGRCRHCHAAIRVRYPAVELATAAVFVALALRLGLDAALPAYLYVAAAGVALAVIDVDVKRLPNVIVLPAYVAGLALLLIPAVTDHRWSAYGRAVLGLVALFAFYFVLAFVYPAGMGFGDVKLAGVLGLYLGWLSWTDVLVGAFLGFLLGGVVGIGLLVAGRAGRRSALPFGPFMLLGALVAILVGDRLGTAYLALTVR